MIRSLGLLLIVGACGSSPANVAGTYTVAVTNRDNGCQFQNWTVGQQTTNIAVDITQDMNDASSATANVNGFVGGYLDLTLGAHTFTGHVDGDSLSLKLYGTRSYTQSSCSYTINGNLSATLAGDALSGSIVYTSATNGSPDCGTIQGCQSKQDFNGTRPPAP